MALKTCAIYVVILVAGVACSAGHAARRSDRPQFKPKTMAAYDAFAVDISTDCRYALSGGSDTLLRVWDLSLGELVRTLRGQSKDIDSVAFSPERKYALAGSTDLFKLWDLDTAEEVRTFTVQGGFVRTLLFSPDGKRGLSGNGEVIKVWDLTTGKDLWTFPARSKEKHAVVFCPREKSITAGTEENGKGYINVWNTSTGERMKSDPLPEGYFASAFSMDCRLAVVEPPEAALGRGKKWPMLWDVEKRRVIRRLKHEVAPFSSYFYPAFSADAKYLLSGYGTPVLVVWDVSTGEAVRYMTGHRDTIMSGSIFPNGERVVSGSIDGSIRLWSVAAGKEIVQMVGFRDGEWIVITPEGYYNASANGDTEMLAQYESGDEDQVACFRETFFRPDLVKLALSGGSLASYKRIFDVPRPPEASIIDTPATTDKETVTVIAKIIDQGGGIGDIKLYKNDALVVTDKLKQEEAVAAKRGFTIQRAYEVRLDPGSNVLRLVAYNSSNSARSTYALREVKCQAH
jgi:hypothetical protein